MLPMTAMRQCSGIGVIASTTVAGFATIASNVANAKLLPDIVCDAVLATAVVCWVAYIAALCRDYVMYAIDRRLTEIQEAITDYGDRRSTEGIRAGMRAQRDAGLRLID